MRTKVIYLIFVFQGIHLSIGCSNEDGPNRESAIPNFENSEEVLNFSENQLKMAVHCADSVTEENPSMVSPIGIDHITGTFVMGNAYSWRCGFFPGSLWMMYEWSKDEFWKTNAVRHTEAIQASCTTSGHDLGFMFNNSYGKAYRITKDIKWLDVLKKAGETLAGRFNPIVGCIRSWGKVDDKISFTVIIDNMMNLELLFEMTRLTGDSTYYEMAYSHAIKTMTNHFRPNYSSYHVVEYNQNDGSIVGKHTSQGCSDESYWSRGQAWGLYGFTMCYRYTHDEKMLNQAKHIANFLLSLQYDDDLIPYWDMLSPDIPNTVRDASAGAIMASALVELSRYCNDDEKSKYLTHAIKIVENLHDDYESKQGENYGFLLLHSTQNYNQDDMVDSPLVYADYYYIEAVMRLLNYYHLEDYIINS